MSGEPIPNGDNVVSHRRFSGTSGEAARDSVRRLITFLKEITELRWKTVRDVDDYERVLWLSDLPREPECLCAAWDLNEDPSPEAWLSISKPRLMDPPVPPSEIQRWLKRDELNDCTLELPELRESILVPAAGDEEPSNRQVLLADHPEIRVLWENYVESQWWPWKERTLPKKSVNDFYTELFSIYQRQSRLGEQFEVVVGLGLLGWKDPHGQRIRRHLITAHCEVAFDAERGVLTVGPAGDGARPGLEQDMIDPVHRPPPATLSQVEPCLTDLSDDVWDVRLLGRIFSSWANSVPSSNTPSLGLEAPTSLSEHPQITLAPAIVLRRRSERSFVRFFEELLKHIDLTGQLPGGLAGFVAPPADRSTRPPSESEAAVDSPDEVYFPLEANDQQRQILTRLADHPGVLVQGPPGTGKSHTIVNLICHLLATGQRVLVTSHTTRALAVIQRFLAERVPDIAPLSVVLVANDRDGLIRMEESVQGITDRHHRFERSQHEREIGRLEAELGTARRDKASALARLRAIREQEIQLYNGKFTVYSGTLARIAEQLRSEADQVAWFEDRPEEAAVPLAPVEAGELLDLLREPTDQDVEPIDLPPNPNTLPSPEDVSRVAARLLKAERKLADCPGQDTKYYGGFCLLEDAGRTRLRSLLKRVRDTLDRVNEKPGAWDSRAALAVLSGNHAQWTALFEETKGPLERVGELLSARPEAEVTIPAKRDRATIRADAEDILNHLEQGGSWGFWPLRKAVAKRSGYLKTEVRVDGRPCSTPAEIRELIRWLDIDKSLSQLSQLWSRVAPVGRQAFPTWRAHFTDLENRLEGCQSLKPVVEEVGQLIEHQSFAPQLSSKSSLDEAIAALTAAQLQAASQATASEMALLRAELDRIAETATRPLLQPLKQALESCDAEGYEVAYRRLADTRARALRRERTTVLLRLLSEGSPRLAANLKAKPHEKVWNERIADYLKAFRWGQARAWMEKLTDPDEEERQRQRLDAERGRVRKLLEMLATAHAWSHCFRRMTESQRQHLVAWSKAMRAVGKGTGKYAASHRRTAREHMKECRSAIPSWVMPLYRVAETVNPGKDLFDVAIIDEASQSGPEALLLLGLAKKLVVVGDDKQISPDNVGLNRENVEELRERHIPDLDLSKQFNLENSFFDLAEIKYEGRIRLREHFRCMPEIIQFSNNLCYQSEPLTPLRQFGAGRLEPVLSLHHVAGGYRKGKRAATNPPEAEALAEAVLACSRDPRYTNKQFGVISLLGRHQAQLIEQLLVERLGPEEMERRSIVCGDAYDFQGDERDVMFLSLVAAPSEHTRLFALTGESQRRRFNVAVSRARDQVFLFHTATRNDLSKDCFRYRLLEYFENPSVEHAVGDEFDLVQLEQHAVSVDRSMVKPPIPFDSWFEVDVFLAIVKRGFRVVPQYGIAGYYIDLLVQGMKGRLAVECDGDRWHGPEQYMRDTARQRDLERCGLPFWRVRESVFRSDRELALEPLWRVLDREGLHPRVHEPRDNQGSRPRAEPSKEAGPTPGSCESEEDHEDTASGALGTQSDLFNSTPASEPSFTVEPRPTSAARDPTPFAIERRPFQSWQPGHLPDPAETPSARLVPGLLSIVAIEGPLYADEAMRIFNRAAGGSRLRGGARTPLQGALELALRNGDLQAREETAPTGGRRLLVWASGMPDVLARDRGPRQFVNVPVSEVASVLGAFASAFPHEAVEATYRRVMAFYDTKKLTPKIRSHLRAARELTHPGLPRST